jgi:DNA-binding transcriptional LysR family regulator
MEASSLALADIALFVEVARTGSFRHAAARLAMPPSTLSRRIAAMEVRLGVPLLLRTTRSVTLTPAAVPFYQRCLDVVVATERARAALGAVHDRPARLRIAMPVDLGVELLGPAIAAFADRHPGLRIEFDLSARAVDLLREPVDLALRIGKPMDDRVVARRIAGIRSGLYAAPALLARLAPLHHPGQLADLPCLDLRTAQGSMPWRIGTTSWDAAPGPCTLAANSVSLMRRFAEDGRGIALLPEHIALPAQQAGRLARVLPAEATPQWPVFAVTAGRSVSPMVRALIADLRQGLLQSLPDGG